MSPRGVPQPTTEPVLRAARRVAGEVGVEIHEERRRRRWTLRELGRRAGLTATAIQQMETGRAGSVEAYARVAIALGLRPELHLVDERRAVVRPSQDAVHAWVGDVEAGHLQRLGFSVAIDEPYQHFQFAGRGDLVAWSVQRSALLHIENRTRFPNLQESLGSYNAKRAYLAAGVADRVHLRRGFATVTHVMCGLWSAEVTHVVRLRTATFRAACPDADDALEAWWRGDLPPAGVTSAFVLFDPLDRPRRRRWVGLDGALTAEARYRGYAEAAAAIR
jgi:transcriptional regulator with XRE-family HTH domain